MPAVRFNRPTCSIDWNMCVCVCVCAFVFERTGVCVCVCVCVNHQLSLMAACASLFRPQGLLAILCTHTYKDTHTHTHTHTSTGTLLCF